MSKYPPIYISYVT